MDSRASAAPIEVLNPWGFRVGAGLWAALGGAGFYGVSYFLYLKSGSAFSARVFLSLFVAGAVLGVGTLLLSSVIKMRFLRSEDVRQREVLGSISMGRVAFALFIPLVFVSALFGVRLGLYALGLALVVQKAVEIISLVVGAGVSLMNSLVSALSHSLVFGFLFWILIRAFS